MKRTACIIGWVVALSLSGFAEKDHYSKKLYIHNENVISVTIPFKLIHNLIIIPVQINGSDTLRFILDTGLTTTLITELGIQDSLSLTMGRELELHGLGQGDPVKVLHSYGNEVNISGIIGYNLDIYVFYENLFRLSEKMGMRVHGILGYDIFKDFIVEIDYDNMEITFNAPGDFKYRKAMLRRSMPLKIINTKPYITIQTHFPDGTVKPANVLLDIGASHSLWLNMPEDDAVGIQEKTPYTYLGSGLNGDVYGHYGRIAGVSLNKYSLNRVIASFPDSTSVSHALDMEHRNGSIGSEILRRFNLIIDYPNGRLTLLKNSHFNQPFDLNMSGFEVIAPYPEISVFEIFHVRDDSPAAVAGVKPGDMILKVNHRNTSYMKLNDLLNILDSREGKKIKLELLREGKTVTVDFKLESFL